MTEDRTEQTGSVIASTEGESSHPLSAAVSRRCFLQALAFGALGATGIAILPKVIQDALSSMSPTAIANPKKTATPGATATATEAPTATTAATTTVPTETATPEPAKTIEPPKPAREQTFSNGAIERYDMITERNADQYFITISRDEFEQFKKEQAGKRLFPFSPKGKFSMGTYTYSDGVMSLVIYSSDISVSAPEDGQYYSSNLKGSVGVAEGSDTSKSSYYDLSIVTHSPNPKIKFDPVFPEGLQTTQPINKDPHYPPVSKKTGEHLFDFFGADPYSNGDHPISANQLSFRLIQTTIVDPGKPVEIGGIKGTMGRVTKTKNLTPSFTDLTKWLSKDGKVIVLKP